MDRDELQDRIRARRSGGDPYRRGGTVHDERRGYERFEPDPIDAQARRSMAPDGERRDFFDQRAAVAPAVPAPDLTRDRDEWARPASAPTPAAAPPPAFDYAPPPSDVPVEDEYVDNFEDAAYDDEPYAYQEYSEPERRSGVGAFAILGILALGVLALISGAVLAGLFDGGPGGVADATATPAVTVAPSATAIPSATPAASGSADASGSPGASGEPVIFPDGFTAEAQPCVRGSWTATGCDSNGASNAGSVDIWIGFQNGTSNDVVGATLIAPDGGETDASIDLADIGCTASCNGYTYFPFDGLSPGTYEVRVTRNGELAGTTTFEVS